METPERKIGSLHFFIYDMKERTMSIKAIDYVSKRTYLKEKFTMKNIAAKTVMIAFDKKDEFIKMTISESSGKLILEIVITYPSIDPIVEVIEIDQLPVTDEDINRIDILDLQGEKQEMMHRLEEMKSQIKELTLKLEKEQKSKNAFYFDKYTMSTSAGASPNLLPNDIKIETKKIISISFVGPINPSYYIHLNVFLNGSSHFQSQYVYGENSNSYYACYTLNGKTTEIGNMNIRLHCPSSSYAIDNVVVRIDDF